MTFWALLGLLFCGPGAEAKNGEFQIDLRGDLVRSSFALENSRKASFGGFGYGLALNSLLTEGKQGIAWRLAFANYRLENSAATNGSSEKLRGYTLGLGARIVSLGLYVGLAALYAREEISYQVSQSSPQVSEYSGVGARIETGLNLALSKNISLIPALHYDVRNLRSKDGSSRRSNSFFAGLGLGFRFD